MPWKPIKGRENLGPSEIQRRMIPADAGDRGRPVPVGEEVRVTGRPKRPPTVVAEVEHGHTYTPPAPEPEYVAKVVRGKPQRVELSRLDDPKSFEPEHDPVATAAAEGELSRVKVTEPFGDQVEVVQDPAVDAPKPKAKRVAHKKVGSAKREAEKVKRAKAALVDIGGDSAKAAARAKWRAANREKERVADAARKKAKRVEGK